MENMTLNIGLCDDKQNAHDTVERLLLEYSKDRNISISIKHYYSARQLLNAEDNIEVLLLDIEMPEMDGIKAGTILMNRGIDYKIIMLTSKIKRFKEAFEINAFRFVSKPINTKEFYKAIDDVRKRLIGNNMVKVFSDGTQYEIVEKDIFFIESASSKTLIYTMNKEYRSEKSLTSWMSELDNRLFYQCHKSFIVNMGKIDKIEKDIITLINDNKVSVSRRLYKPLLQVYMKYDTKRR